MNIDFSNWLIEQMKKKGWSQADLSRAAGLTRQAIANYAAGRIPQDDSILKIAFAFNLPPEQVYRAAGLLPPAIDIDEDMEQIMHETAQLSKTDQREILAYVRMKRSLREKNK
jgi:transcriptional regulator with XRE-family HTH domain